MLIGGEAINDPLISNASLPFSLPRQPKVAAGKRLNRTTLDAETLHSISPPSKSHHRSPHRARAAAVAFLLPTSFHLLKTSTHDALHSVASLGSPALVLPYSAAARCLHSTTAAVHVHVDVHAHVAPRHAASSLAGANLPRKCDEHLTADYCLLVSTSCIPSESP